MTMHNHEDNYRKETYRATVLLDKYDAENNRKVPFPVYADSGGTPSTQAMKKK